MQTRRDQLQAYRFQNRRALAALVTGEPNVVEPPMRRLTVMTIAGIMIAILVAVVFALLGKFSPDTGDSWKEAGAVIIDNNTGATYLYDNRSNEIHPVVNYTSAVLAIQANSGAHTVHVDSNDIKSAKRGYLVGIRGLPFTLPGKSGLIAGPWTVCSTLHTDSDTSLVSVRTAVHADSTAGSRALAQNSPVLVRGVQGGSTYLLAEHQRLAITREVAATLQLTAPPVPVSTAFLDGVPAGPPLDAPEVAGAGAPSTLLPGARVGQLVKESGNGGTAVVLRDGFQPLSNQVQVAVMQTLRVAGSPLPPVSAPASLVASNLSKSDGAALTAALGRLPAQLDTPSPATQRAAGVCAVYRSSKPSFALVAGDASTQTAKVSESKAAAAGQADDVDVPSDAAALVRSDDNAKTVFVVDPSGQKFALGNGAQAKIGYDGATPQVLARQLLALVPSGPAMDPAAAAKPASP